MKKKNVFLLGMLVMILAFGMTVTGCFSFPARAPASFVRGSAGDTTILLRPDLDFDLAFREVAFILNRHGFDTEMIQPEVGFIRTRWNRWGTADVTTYRVRIIGNFNPARTQLIVKAEAEHNVNGVWDWCHGNQFSPAIKTEISL